MSLFTTRSRLVLRLKKSSAQEEEKEEEEEATTLPTLHGFQLFLSLNAILISKLSMWHSLRQFKGYGNLFDCIKCQFNNPISGLSDTGLQIHENTDNCFTTC